MKYPELLMPDTLPVRDEVIARMQKDDPMYWCDHPAIQAWFVTRYEDVYQLFRDERLEFGSTGAEIAKQAQEQQQALRPLVQLTDNLLSAMPKERHKVVQNIYMQFFSPRILKEHQAPMQASVDRVLDQLVARNEVDLVSEFSYAIPANIISGIIGVPEQDRARFVAQTAAIEALFWPYDFERYKTAMQSVLEMTDYSKQQMKRAVKDGDNTLFAMLGDAVDRGEITEDEAAVNAVATLFAGHETSASVINSGLNHLRENPALLARLRDDPQLFAPFTAEILRYRPAIGWMRRTCVEGFEFNGVSIEPGHVLYLGTYAANHDASCFPNPGEFDLHRKGDKVALTFGVGRHYCLGARLAMTEIEMALRTLMTRFPALKFHADKIEQTPSLMLMNAFTKMPVTLV
jgi:cytochrome P450